MSHPSLPVTRVNILTADRGQADIAVAAPLSFTNPAHRPAVLAGKTLLVDAVNGDDSIAVRGNHTLPFATPAAAKAAASAGDLVMVLPGTYTVTASLAKNGVNWHFHAGAAVTLAGSGDIGIWDDGGSAMTFRVSGQGDFTRTSAVGIDGSLNVVRCSHASSVITVEANDLSATTASDDETYVINQRAGLLYVTARNITGVDTSGAGLHPVYWENGQMHLRAQRIAAQSGIAVYGRCNATPTGEMYVEADEISSQNSHAVANFGSNSAAAMWVVCKIAKTAGGISNAAPCSMSQGNSKTYLTAQKIFGHIKNASGTGLHYVRADKIAAVANAGIWSGLIHCLSGTLRVTVMHLDVVTFTGPSITVAGGELQIQGGACVGNSGSTGFVISGGTARLSGVRIDTAANAAADPVVKSGGTLVLDHSTLVAEGSRDSIAASSAQTVVSLGSYANRAANGNVSVSGSLTVGSYVQ